MCTLCASARTHTHNTKTTTDEPNLSANRSHISSIKFLLSKNCKSWSRTETLRWKGCVQWAEVSTAKWIEVKIIGMKREIFPDVHVFHINEKWGLSSRWEFRNKYSTTTVAFVFRGTGGKCIAFRSSCIPNMIDKGWTTNCSLTDWWLGTAAKTEILWWYT